jgi:hypothetical protein
VDDDALDEIAEDLYGVPPQEFVDARTAARDRVKAADKELAKAVAALPKPTTAAWVCNLLVRRRPAEVAQLRDLGELLRQAQATLSGDQLRQLGQQRNQVVAALAREARGLAHAEGQDVSTAVAEQVESTLRAAVVDPDAGEALAAGRLTTALSYSGLGPVDLSGAVATPVRSGPGRPTAAAQPASDTKDADADARERAAEERRQREREQARRDAEEAASVARDTAAAAQAAEEKLTAAGARRDELRERAEQLAGELRRVEREAKEAVAAVQEAEKRRDAAVRRADTAAAIRDRAAARVEQLTAGG